VSIFEDGHSRLETPVLIPNTEVKLPTLLAVVAHKPPNLQAVFFLYILFLHKTYILFKSNLKIEDRKKELSGLQRKIVRRILKDKIENISYYHPKDQLREIANNYDETISALRSLQNDFRVITLNPQMKLKRRFFKTNCAYSIDMEQIEQLIISG